MPRTCAPLLVLLTCQVATSTTLYTMPKSLNLTTHARVDPTTTLFDDTSISLWRIASPGEECLPIGWDGSNWTGLHVPPGARLADQAGLQPDVVGSTFVQYSNSSFGTQLNLYDTPPTASLGTITVEFTWSQPNWITPWARGLTDATLVECTMLYQAPTAKKEGVAIYSSWSLGFHNVNNISQYVWYETALFDLDRAFSQTIFSKWLRRCSVLLERRRNRCPPVIIAVDTISGYPIIHSYLGVQSQRYHSELPGCMQSSNATIRGLRAVAFTINSTQFAAAIADANVKSGEAYSTDPSLWRLGHWNIEAEGEVRSRRDNH